MSESDRLAEEHHFHKIVFETPAHRILAYLKPGKNTALVRVYLEGDGAAWLTEILESVDPTPADPVGLKLAIADASTDTILYLARPGQYVEDARYTPELWTQDRFSKNVLASYQWILNALRSGRVAFQGYSSQQPSFILFGYSGGGAIALALAAKASDVKAVVTFAGVLSPEAWTKYHSYLPLTVAEDPATLISQLSKVPQVHFVGEDDHEVPPVLTQQFVQSFPKEAPVSLKILPNIDHHSRWDTFWAMACRQYNFNE